MQPLPPEVDAFFKKQQEEQQKLNKTAHVKKSLRETERQMTIIMQNLVMRGEDVNEAEQVSERLLSSSNEFLQQTKSCSCIPSWWCSARESSSSKKK
jgi:hypothetical protein